jgi:hypothetical protein
MALKRISIPSPCWSSRGGAKVRLIVIHTAEGATTIESLGSFFQNPANQVSSHTGADDKANTVGQYVQRGNKSWTCANYNPVAVQIEACGFASWSTDLWRSKHDQMLRNIAAWVKEESQAFGIPIVKLNASQAQGTGAGVCQHRDLGAGGGGHTDCGNGFPIDYVLDLAKGGGGSQPDPPPSGKGPAWPYGPSDYLGQPDPDPHCHSGYYGGVDTQNVKTWQTQMRARKWNLTADGQYGPKSEQCCRQFQKNKGLTADGLCGPQTWSATWNLPIGG